MGINPDETLLIVGSGAMACLFAARLAASGVRVLMLGSWPEGLDVLRNQGVTLLDPDGSPPDPARVLSSQTYPVLATDEPLSCRGVKQALVLVKSWQTERAAQQLSQCLAPDGVALTLQNGLGNRETLAHTLGAKRIALGVTTLGAHLVGPGRVQPGGDGVISLGIHSRMSPLAALLRSAGFIVDDAANPDGLLWGKMVINAAINPLTAILGVPNGELLKRPTARALLANLAREAASVAIALGIPLPYPDPVVASETIARRTASNLSSMLQDVTRHAPTEIDAISGAIVHAGEQANVPTPLNRTMWQLVKALAAVPTKTAEGLVSVRK